MAEPQLDPALPRLHLITSVDEALTYFSAHINRCINYPNPYTQGTPLPLSTLHSISCWLIEFVDQNRTANGQRTFDNLITEENLLTAVELDCFRKNHLFGKGKTINLAEPTGTGADWWHRMHRFMYQLNKVYLPIFVARHENWLLPENATDPFERVPDPPLKDELRNEFIILLQEVAVLKLAQGPSRQLWTNKNSPDFQQKKIQAAAYEIADTLCLPTVRLDREIMVRERHLADVRKKIFSAS